MSSNLLVGSSLNSAALQRSVVQRQYLADSFIAPLFPSPTHLTVLSPSGLNSQTGEERRLLEVEEVEEVEEDDTSCRPGREPLVGKQPRTGSEEERDLKEYESSWE